MLKAERVSKKGKRERTWGPQGRRGWCWEPGIAASAAIATKPTAARAPPRFPLPLPVTAAAAIPPKGRGVVSQQVQPELLLEARGWGGGNIKGFSQLLPSSPP